VCETIVIVLVPFGLEVVSFVSRVLVIFFRRLVFCDVYMIIPQFVAPAFLIVLPVGASVNVPVPFTLVVGQCECFPGGIWWVVIIIFFASVVLSIVFVDDVFFCFLIFLVFAVFVLVNVNPFCRSLIIRSLLVKVNDDWRPIFVRDGDPWASFEHLAPIVKN
jgi:hypothetical protein